MKTEDKIRMANQMYECRRTVKALYGTDWKTALETFKSAISKRMKADAIDEITAAIRVSHEGKEKGIDATLFLMAAAVDMVEPE